MNQTQFNAFCAALPHTTHVVQWGGSDVWKIGGKVFAVAGWNEVEDGSQYSVSFKCSQIGFEMLRDTPGCRPAPYLASRGMPWIQWQTDTGISADEMLDYVKNSYRLVSLGLTKKLQRELGLNQEVEA